MGDVNANNFFFFLIKKSGGDIIGEACRIVNIAN